MQPQKQGEAQDMSRNKGGPAYKGQRTELVRVDLTRPLANRIFKQLKHRIYDLGYDIASYKLAYLHDIKLHFDMCLQIYCTLKHFI